MDAQGNNGFQGKQPVEPDESWWSAVLADEPSMEEEIEPEDSALKQYPTRAETATSSLNWDRVDKIYSNDEIVELTVVGFNRGGVLVAGEDIHGFVPASHLIEVPAESIELEREDCFSQYLDCNIRLKIIECEQEKERLVFSERAALAGEGQRRYLLSSLKPGDVVKGVVTNVTDFGVFVDLGGLEGLVHVSELSWGRVQHPSEILKLDEVVSTVVVQVSEDKGRIALSLKRLKDNPWEEIGKKLTMGDVVPAEIKSIVKFGAFAQLREGVEGLIHISSMNFPQGCTRIDDFLFRGQAVMVCILNIDIQKRRLGLKLDSYSSD